MCSPVRTGCGVNKMSGSEKVIVGLKSRSISYRSPVLTHNSPLVACKKALKIFFPRYFFQTSRNVERTMVVVVKFVLTNLDHTNVDV